MRGRNASVRAAAWERRIRGRVRGGARARESQERMTYTPRMRIALDPAGVATLEARFDELHASQRAKVDVLRLRKERRGAARAFEHRFAG
jgi:hypothetical protein